MFEFLKKRRELKKYMVFGVLSLKKLRNADINDIWEINDKKAFLIAMKGWVDRKCDYGKHMEFLSTQERVFYLTRELEAGVDESGYLQYLYGESGAFYGELQGAFMEIGAYRTAETCRKAAAVFGCELPADLEERTTVLVEGTEPQTIDRILECDDEFFEDDLDELNYRLIMNNKEAFR